jgi:hypothetical protein
MAAPGQTRPFGGTGIGGTVVASRGGVGGGVSGFNSVVNGKNGPPNAAIKPPKVERPSWGDYGPDPIHPNIPLPNRSDFGHASREGIDAAKLDVNAFRKGFNDPTSTNAFKDIMSLASNQGASALSEINRGSREAASKAGYTGGFSTRGKEADAARFAALSSAGFEGAGKVRADEGAMYGKALDNLTAMIGNVNNNNTASNIAFGNAVGDAHKSRAESDLAFSKLVQDKNLSFADATAAAKNLQAQLDQAYNGSLIDNARYNQMSASLQAQLQMEQARLKESGRQFDVTHADNQAAIRAAQAEAARLRNERGVDPTTGKHYGQGDPTLGTGRTGTTFTGMHF